MTNVFLDIDALRSSLQSVRDTIVKLTAAGAGEEVLEPFRRGEAQLQQQIDTGGGALVLGNVATGGGRFVGRDEVHVTIAENLYMVGVDADGLIVANAVGERRRLPLDQAPTGKLLAFYYRWLAAECRRLPLGVIDNQWLGAGEQQTVPLPDVYVDLDVIPSAPKEAESQRGWAMRLVRGLGESSTRVPALAALARERLAVLVGDAGSGKTTFVNYLAYLLAQPESPTASALPEALRGHLVARLVLRDVAADHVPADARRGEASMLWQALEADLARALGAPAAARLLPDLQQPCWRLWPAWLPCCPRTRGGCWSPPGPTPTPTRSGGLRASPPWPWPPSTRRSKNASSSAGSRPCGRPQAGAKRPRARKGKTCKKRWMNARTWPIWPRVRCC